MKNIATKETDTEVQSFTVRIQSIDFIDKLERNTASFLHTCKYTDMEQYIY